MKEVKLTEAERRILMRLTNDCLKDLTHSEATLTNLFEIKRKLTK